MSISKIVIITILSLLPSFIWLLYYLRKDPHPEPKKIIIKLFLIGFLITPIAAIIEIYGQHFLGGLVENIIIIIMGGAFIEEFLKYLAARRIIARNKKEFDEPSDAMIYLITIALGFAASENIIILFSSYLNGESINQIIITITLRFWGATLLHTLSSGIIGYYIAQKYFYNKKYQLTKGFIIATTLHAVFNYFIITTQNIKYTEYNLLFGNIELVKYLLLSLIIILLGAGLFIIHKEFKKLSF